jgi:hypothetical protein
MSAVVRITETNRGSGNRPPPRDIGSSEFRSCATIASSELSAVPICFAPLQRALGSTSGHISERPGVAGEIISAIDARFSHKNAAVAARETCLRARKLA